MRRLQIFSIALLFAAICAPTSSFAQARLRINPDNIAELFAYLDSCIKYIPGSEGSEMTLRFGITHTGELKGPPLVNYSSLQGSEETQRAFRAMILDALNTCVPIPVTAQFGRIASSKLILWKAHALVPPASAPPSPAPRARPQQI